MIGKYYPLPFSFKEPEGNEAAMILDGNGNAVAMLMWAMHPPEEEDEATEETYEVGRLFAASCDSGSGPKGEKPPGFEGEAPQSGLSASEGIAQNEPNERPNGR